jgi:A/G-specific adenine glycosylase
MPRSPDVALRRALLAWYDRVRRPLPWRGGRDPYRVWISEIMLQQTTVRAVVPYYEAFLAEFPDLRSLAAAPLEAVLARWSGLGYYSRARNLHAAARRVVETHGGTFPRTPEEVRALPGIGDYTTAAILSIVHDAPLAVVDGNVIRVVARLLAESGHARSTSLVKAVRARAQALLDPARPGDFNQAMMELGATVCAPRSPDCGGCPLRRSCRARALGTPTAFPAPPPKREPTVERWLVGVVRSQSGLLMRRRPSADPLMGGLWELPAWLLEEGEAPEAALSRRLDVVAAAGAGGFDRRGAFRHAIMNRRLTCEVVAGRLGPRRAAPAGYRWVPEDDVPRLGTSSTVRKALKLAPAGAPEVTPA